MAFSIFLITFFALIILKCPMAFCMIISSIFYMCYQNVPITVVAQNLAYNVWSYTLVAIPLYILVGRIMNQIGATERIFNFALSLVGHIKGGLGHVNVLASMIFSGMSGSAAADAGGLGVIEVKAMLKEGYDPDFSAAITATSSTIGPVIPPSIIMVVYASIAEVSVGKMFLGGFFPGTLMGLSMMALIYLLAKSNRINCPSRSRAGIKLVIEKFKEAFPPLLTIIIVLGSIIFGYATPTEAGALAVVYSLILGIIWKKINIPSLWNVIRDSFLAAASVSLIIASAGLVGWIITLEHLPDYFINSLFSLTNNKIIILMIINILLLIWGCVMDPLPILMIAAPVFVPLANALGMDLVHFGVMMVLNLMIGLITPPLGISLYVVSDFSGISVERLSKAAFPFIIPLVITLLICTYFPLFVTFLPDLLIK